MHGGSVSAASDGEGKGSEFTVHLPLEYTDDSKETKPPEETRMIEEMETPKKKILIVDDNADVAEMVKALLSIEGHDVRVATNGESDIETAKEYQPDVCLCDIGLPKMDGYELGRQLRELLPNTKLIAFSGWGQDSDKERSREAGFDEHLVKASNIDQLIKLIA
jgi:CheY-like chemotaxis protein